jgi:prepilin-type N-terminal cleavage/methylation domain-containing protein
MTAIRYPSRPATGYTLIEVVVSLAIGGIMVAGMIAGYVQAATHAEWSAYSLAAQSLAMQRIEQTRAARWDTLHFPPIDQVVSSNFPITIEMLDVPVSGGNPVLATNYTTITTVSTDPPLKFIQVDCVWPFANRGVFTNTIITYRAPGQ